MIIGARIWKTGLAVALSLWIGQWIGLSSPHLAAMAAIFTIQPSIHRSWIEILRQAKGNLLGAGIAIIGVWTIGDNPLVVGLVCVGVILLCIKLDIANTISLTLVIVVVIMEAQGQGWLVASQRVAAIFIGMICAFFVNVMVAPPQHHARFFQQVEEAQGLMSRLLRTTVSDELKENVYCNEQEQLQRMVQDIEFAYALFSEERVVRKNTRLKRAHLLLVYKGMLESLKRGYALIEAMNEHYWTVHTPTSWNELVTENIEALCHYHEHLLWKWNDKMKSTALMFAPSSELTRMLSEVSEVRNMNNHSSRANVLIISAAVMKYETSLHRLDQLMDQWLKRQKQFKEAAE